MAWLGETKNEYRPAVVCHEQVKLKEKSGSNLEQMRIAKNYKRNCFRKLYSILRYFHYKEQFIPDVHKIPARVQVCKLAVSNLHPPPYRSRQIICLFHSRVRSPSPHQLHAGPGRSIPCTAQQRTSSHTVRCARLVHLWFIFSITDSSHSLISSLSVANSVICDPEAS
jgi:hypothetical protein